MHAALIITVISSTQKHLVVVSNGRRLDQLLRHQRSFERHLCRRQHAYKGLDVVLQRHSSIEQSPDLTSAPATDTDNGEGNIYAAPQSAPTHDSDLAPHDLMVVGVLADTP
ncbi:hypothetical protein LEL_09983 [Akanthomyces lecanii RCEF 1005]|uniref:Uncharacterized protein n=1 Tax=Akanthomyces lecanii RCEF 1005 TaxID=1081108 RepID=A0A168BIJ8_CORDF|nr:hypothetical protein LEL_09983 [Akanthomyces lecanii RCEF 1005]